MQYRPFGRTGLTVSVLGFGAGHVGGHELTEDEAGTILNAAVDRGVTLIDTARGYGLSEERIGRHLSWRRKDFILSSKCGYGIAGSQDWTPDCITRGVDEALRVMRTDTIDIMHLHSCPRTTLEHGGVLEALERAREAGKIRVVAYSGEEEHRRFAIDSGQVGSIQTSINLCDQRVLESDLPEAAARGLGVIAKRPIANAFWRFADRPVGDYCETYWERARTMQLHPPAGMAWGEFALRFVAHLPGVQSCIVGTRSVKHLEDNIRQLAAGPLSDDIVQDARQRFRTHGAEWFGQV